MKIGFSTGSLAGGDFQAALAILQEIPTEVVEISALREAELFDLLIQLDGIDLSKYNHVSIHAPSRLEIYSEREVIDVLQELVRRGAFVVVHPDIIREKPLWKSFGFSLCLENMDKRKTVGRSYKEMENLFAEFPEASFCLDIAHAKQIDPAMVEAYLMLKHLRNRLVQIHMSDVTSDSRHVRLNIEAMSAYSELADLIPETVPIILESPVGADAITQEIALAQSVFSKRFALNR